MTPRTTNAADIALYIAQHYEVFLYKRAEFIEMLQSWQLLLEQLEHWGGPLDRDLRLKAHSLQIDADDAIDKHLLIMLPTASEVDALVDGVRGQIEETKNDSPSS